MERNNNADYLIILIIQNLNKYVLFGVVFATVFITYVTFSVPSCSLHLWFWKQKQHRWIWLSATIMVKHSFLVVGRRHWGVPGVKTRGKAQIRIIVNSNGDWWRQGSEFLSVCPMPVWLDLSLLGRSKSRRTIEEITLPPLFIRVGATWALVEGLYSRMNSLHKCSVKI